MKKVEVKEEKLSEELQHLITAAKDKPITVDIMIKEFGTRGNAFLTLVLSGPFILPVPTFGLSALFGMIIAFISVFIIIDKEPYLPKKLAHKNLPNDHLMVFLRSSHKFISKIEKFVKPRWLFIESIVPVRILSGVMIFVATILLALPLPPGTNAPPAACIILLSLALIEQDNLFFLLGTLVFILNLVLFGLLFFTGVKGIEYLFS
jgi:hypothetical protein